MSHAPATLVALLDYWVRRGGIALGAIGDADHTYGYHLGRDRIYASTGQGDDDYSVQSPRDRLALSDAVAAVDLGHADLSKLRAFSHWLVVQARANVGGTSDIREIIYSPDGSRVLCWDRERGRASAPIVGEGDDSHLWHTHISYYRDSEPRDKIALVRLFLEPAGPASWSPPVGAALPGEALAGGDL